MSNGLENFFKGLGHDILVAAEKIKAVAVDAANEIPAVTAIIAKDTPEIAQLANLIPGAGPLVPVGVSAVESICSLISKGGAAAEQNLLNAGLDQDVITAAKAIVPAFEAFANAKKAAAQ